MSKDDQNDDISSSKSKKEKTPRIYKKDWDKVQEHLMTELDSRKRSGFRRSQERKWKEVDRQIEMEAMIKRARDGTEVPQDWHNIIELGELSKASENMSADVRRITFPQSRYWFEPHSDTKQEAGFNQQTGEKKEKQQRQQMVDGRLRAFMMQQHTDFGLKDRVELSIKEALHHGSFVVEVDWEEQKMVFGGEKTKTIGAPVWIPHSMWNSYPDPSPSVVGTNMFYTGTMFIESYLPRYKCEKLVNSGEDGYLASQWKKVPKDEHVLKDQQRTKDVKIVTYWGDIMMERNNPEENLYFPNHKVQMMNGIIVYFLPNDTPYPNLIYRGYERTDIRNPYYTSPIIKQSPMQKLASTLANKTMDGIELHLEPPIVYDGNDPDFVLNGGPDVRPGSKVSAKGSNAFQQVKIGDPEVAITGLELALNQMKEKLGRPGKPVGDRATKAEVVKSSQDQEVSLVDFIDKVEIALRSFLYMQHEMNLRKLDTYFYYSPEMQDPDFLVVKKDDLPKKVHFDVVGARGVLGEQERAEKMTMVTGFASQNPLFAPLLDAKALLMQMYQDAGIKNAERFMVDQSDGNAAQLKMQLQQASGVLKKMQEELNQEKSHNQVKIAKIQADHEAKSNKLVSDYQLQQQKMQQDYDAKIQKIMADFKADIAKLMQEREISQQQLTAEKIVEKVEGIAEKALHKMQLAEVQERKVTGQPSSEEKASQMHQEIMVAMQNAISAMTAPRQYIRDEKNRIVGSRMMQ